MVCKRMNYLAEVERDEKPFGFMMRTLQILQHSAAACSETECDDKAGQGKGYTDCTREDSANACLRACVVEISNQERARALIRARTHLFCRVAGDFKLYTL